MILEAIDRLEKLLNTAPARLYEMDETVYAPKPHPSKWSKKEIIGHLIDSAANNHQRFIRIQTEDLPSIRYDQDKWVAAGHYQSMNAVDLIKFWEAYNRHLLELIRRIPAAALQRKCMVGTVTYTLAFVINDYVDHLEHHLKQILG
jgi:hypothetical protein